MQETLRDLHLALWCVSGASDGELIQQADVPVHLVNDEHLQGRRARTQVSTLPIPGPLSRVSKLLPIPCHLPVLFPPCIPFPNMALPSFSMFYVSGLKIPKLQQAVLGLL
jgi:hypothetical protein